MKSVFQKIRISTLREYMSTEKNNQMTIWDSSDLMGYIKFDCFFVFQVPAAAIPAWPIFETLYLSVSWSNNINIIVEHLDSRQ